MTKMKKMMMKWTCQISSFVGITILASCSQEANFMPKPMGYPRIDFPKEVKWTTYVSDDCPYQFNYPAYSLPIDIKETCNQSIHYPMFNATLFATYIPIDNRTDDRSLFFHSEYSRNLAYEHSIKADEISEQTYVNDSSDVYGIIYSIRGNVATNYQFYLTDSVEHFYRGSLYFNTSPNVDSIKPALDYLTSDIHEMIQSFRWK